ncbi:MAG: hypothetical protein R6U40_08820 [Desulfobacterales bacterium]
MPIENFNGETFVAFLDISGFKELMTDDQKAWKSLDALYRAGYNTLHGNNRTVDGLFVSDCGILFVRNGHDNAERFKSILLMTREINKKMLEENFMLTTTIAFGRFKYQERIEFEGIEKNPIYGNAYVSAYLDNESGKPRIQPGQCRIIKKNLPSELNEMLKTPNHNNTLMKLINHKSGDKNHYYYYWMIDNSSEIADFEKQYSNSYDLKFTGMLKALKGE